MQNSLGFSINNCESFDYRACLLTTTVIVINLIINILYIYILKITDLSYFSMFENLIGHLNEMDK